jgi:hypothetical protein
MLILLGAIMLASSGCGDEGNGITTDTVNDQFSIYLVVNEGDLMRYLAGPTDTPDDLEELVLQAEPVVSIDDIEFYDFSTHSIYLREGHSRPFDGDAYARQVFDKPFVVVANDQRCYLGWFQHAASSKFRFGPCVFFPYALDPEDIIHIRQCRVASPGTDDIRSDKRIRDALLGAGKLHLGLRVELDRLEVTGLPDTSTVYYTFTIFNEDEDDLYVPDPDEMGSDLFHYHSRGVKLSNYQDKVCIVSEYETRNPPEPFDHWDLQWFTRIESGQSIQRTVVLGDYPDMPNGTYSCEFSFSGPGKIQRDERILPDGRIWLGTVDSSTLEVEIGNSTSL